MDFTSGKRIFVYFDTHISPGFVEVLTIQKQSGDLLFFEEKDPYYAVKCKRILFYGYSHNMAGNAIIVEKLWHLPFAQIFEKCRFFISFFGKRANNKQYDTKFKKDSSPIF